MSAPLSPPTTRIESNFELRWSQWLANGALRDAALQRRAVTVAVLLGCGIAVWLSVAIYIG
jgi:hypothetical protein